MAGDLTKIPPLSLILPISAASGVRHHFHTVTDVLVQQDYGILSTDTRR